MRTSQFSTFEAYGVVWNYTYFPGDDRNPPIEEYEPRDCDGFLVTRIDGGWRIDQTPCYRVADGHKVAMRTASIPGNEPPLAKLAQAVSNAIKLEKARPYV